MSDKFLDAIVDIQANLGLSGSIPLSRNAKGPDTARLQADLKALGFPSPSTEIDTQFFGAGTQVALTRYQTAAGLAVTAVLDKATKEAMAKTLAAQGKVAGVRFDGRATWQDHRPADSVTLKIYTTLVSGSTGGPITVTTDAKGYFQTQLSTDPLVSPVQAVEVRVDNATGGGQTVLSKRIAISGTHVEFNPVIPQSVAALPTSKYEYDRLLSALSAKSITGLTGLAAVFTPQLAQNFSVRLGWDARIIGIGALAGGLANTLASTDRPLSAKVLYALFRAGLPTVEDRLSRVDAATVAAALQKAHSSMIAEFGAGVPLTESDTAFVAAKTAFQTFSDSFFFDAEKPPNAVSTNGELIQAANLGLAAPVAPDTTPAATQFAQWKSALRLGREADLWTATGAANHIANNISAENRVRIQTFDILAALTQNNWPLMDVLYTDYVRAQESLTPPPTEPDQRVGVLISHGFHKTAAWEALDILNTTDHHYPPNYGGTVSEQRTAYIKDLASRLRARYPSLVVVQQLQDADYTNIPEGVTKEEIAQLLTNMIGLGFLLGQGGLNALVQSNPSGLYYGLTGDSAHKSAVLAEVRKIDRLFALAPSMQALIALHNAGFNSAEDVLDVPKERFVAKYGALMVGTGQTAADGKKAAKLTYNKAAQVHSIALGMLTAIRTRSATTAAAATTPGADTVNTDLVMHYPTITDLFGSTDSVECADCQSVFSPSAYLVDLFKFLDPGEVKWSEFKDHWNHDNAPLAYDTEFAISEEEETAPTPYQALLGTTHPRRPDLPYLALTCENTNTTLPYIDLANEVMERTVVAAAGVTPAITPPGAFDTGEATEAELGAFPQHSIPEAYGVLAKATYPAPLPYDDGTETVRRLFHLAGRSVAQGLEAWQTKATRDAVNANLTSQPELGEEIGLTPPEYNLLTSVFLPGTAVPAWGAGEVSTGNPCHYEGIIYHAKASFTSAAAPPLDAAHWDVVGRLWYEALFGYDSAPTVAAHTGSVGDNDLWSAKILANRLGVSYAELYRIVATSFVSPALARIGFIDRLGVSLYDISRFASRLSDSSPATDAVEVDSDEEQLFRDRLLQYARACGKTELEVHTAVRHAWLGGGLQSAVLIQPSDTSPDDFSQYIVRLGTVVMEGGSNAITWHELVRMALFVRLWKRLGGTIEEADQALCAYLPIQSGSPLWGTSDGIDDDVFSQGVAKWIQALARLMTHERRLARRLPGVDPVRLRTLWNNLPVGTRSSPYNRLFLSSGARKASPFDNPIGKPPGDGSVMDASAQLFSLLGLTQKDLLTIADEEDLSLENLTVPILSMLVRYQALAEALDLTIPELIQYRALVEESPFPTTDRDHDTTVSTIRFVDQVRRLQSVGLDPATWAYLLLHQTDPEGALAATETIPASLYKTLTTQLTALRQKFDHADPAAITNDRVRMALDSLFPSVARKFYDAWTGATQTNASAPAIKTWVSGSEWNVDDFCTDGVDTYRCKLAVPFSIDLPHLDTGHFTLVPAWNSTGPWAMNDYCCDAGAVYICTGTGATGSPPSDDPTHFALKAVAQLPAPQHGVSWTGGTDWTVGDICADGPTLYRCKSAITGSTDAPGDDSSHFTLIQAWPLSSGAWVADDIALFEGVLYRCTNGTSSIALPPHSDADHFERLPAVSLSPTHTVKPWFDGANFPDGSFCIASGGEGEGPGIYRSNGITDSHQRPQDDATHFTAVRAWSTGEWHEDDLCASGGAVYVCTEDYTAPTEGLAATPDSDHFTLIALTQWTAEPALSITNAEHSDGLHFGGLLLDPNRIAALRTGVTYSTWLPAQQARVLAFLSELAAQGETALAPIVAGVTGPIPPEAVSSLRYMLGPVGGNWTAEEKANFAPGLFDLAYSLAARRTMKDAISSAWGMAPAMMDLFLSMPDPIGSNFDWNEQTENSDQLFGSWDLLSREGTASILLDAQGRSVPHGVRIVETPVNASREGATHIRFQGFFEPKLAGTYNFSILFEGTDSMHPLTAVLRFGVPEQVVTIHSNVSSTGIELKDLAAGVPVPWSMTITTGAGGFQLQCTAPGSEEAQSLPHPALTLRPHLGAHIRTDKLARIVTAFGLAQKDLTELQQSDWLRLHSLPIFPEGTDVSVLSALISYASLKKSRSVTPAALLKALDTLRDSSHFSAIAAAQGAFETDISTLAAVLQNPASTPEAIQTARDALATSGTPYVSALVPATKDLATLMGRSDFDVAVLAIMGGVRVQNPPGGATPVLYGLSSLEDIETFWKACEFADRIGAPPINLLLALQPWGRTSDAVTAIREGVQGKIGERWAQAARPSMDDLRRQRRTALVTYLLRALDLESPEELFEYLLLDPMTEPVVDTSRVQLAIASVQLFIQRCLLGLEEKVHPSAISSEEWSWMKRYRLWEASRRIFVYPENWLEPEFREDKSELFGRLEKALLTSSLTDQVATSAFHDYLADLATIGRLEMISSFIQSDEAHPDADVLHLVARTRTTPRRHFYRTYANRTWSQWEEVHLEGAGDHIAVAFWEGRPHIFWFVFPAAPPLSKDGTGVTSFQLSMSWVQRLNGVWSSALSAGAPFTVTTAQPVEGDLGIRFPLYLNVDTDEVGRTRLTIQFAGGDVVPFVLREGNTTVIQDGIATGSYNLDFANTRLRATLIEADVDDYLGNPTALNVLEAGPINIFQTHPPGQAIRPSAQWRILTGLYRYSLLAADNRLIADDGDEELFHVPLFYQDRDQTLFMEPQPSKPVVVPRPALEVQPPTPQKIFNPADIHMNAHYPDADLTKTAGDPRATTNIQRTDWLTDEKTVFQFGLNDDNMPIFLGAEGSYVATELSGSRLTIQAEGGDAVVLQQNGAAGKHAVLTGTVLAGDTATGGLVGQGGTVRVIGMNGFLFNG